MVMNSKKCKECNKSLNNENNKFCNKSCAATYNNKKYPKKQKKIKTCKNCEKIIIKYNNQYCNLKCFHEYQYKNKILRKFYDGEINSNDTLRKILIKLFGAKCCECGCGDIWNKKKLTLQVDHIDGNSDNNDPENVRLLCPNCHTQTPTYCGLNNKQKNTRRNKYLRKYKNGDMV